MTNPISNVLGQPRTTLAGLLAVLVGGFGQYAVPQVVAYLGGQQSPGWQLLGAAFGLLVPALMRDAKEKLDGLAAPPSPPPAAKGLARLGLLVVLLFVAFVVVATGCGTVSALQGSTGPIVITTAKDPTSGQTVATSTVTVTADKATMANGSCLKSVEVTFDSLVGGHDTCKVQVPFAPVAGACP